MFRLSIIFLCVAVIFVLLCSCENQQTVTDQQVQQLQFRSDQVGVINVEEIQVDLEAFADQYTARIAQAVDLMARETDSVQTRSTLINLKTATGTGSLRIAVGPNPIVATLDMVVHVTLVRRAMENHLLRFVELDCANLFRELQRSEKEIWAISEQILNEAQRAELLKLIDDWCEANPDNIYVFNVRFDDFAALRKSAIIPRARSRESIFSLLLLDPLANLDPTTAELTEARLLTERIFFFAQRLPTLINWRIEAMYTRLIATPEFEQLLLDSRRVGESSERLSRTIEGLEGRIPEHTQTLVREVNTALTQQREALITDLEAQEAVLRPLLDETRVAIEQAEAAAAAITTAMEQSEETANDIERAAQAATEAGEAWTQMAQAVGDTLEILDKDDGRPNAVRPAPTGPPSQPVSTQDVLQSIEQARDTATELRRSLEELNALIADDNLTQRLDDTRQGMNSVLNTATWRGVMLLVIAFFLAVIYRFIAVRLLSR